VILDGVKILLLKFARLFKLICDQIRVSAKWLFTKSIPILKNKGKSKNIESYRPIVNLCSASNFFEILTLKRFIEIHDENLV
jgi:hypothetical protein